VTLLSEQLLNSARSADDPLFTEAITAELRGLLTRGGFQFVPESALPRGANVLGSCFHLTIKSANENIRCKARLVVQAHPDSKKGLIVPEAPTLPHTSMRIVLSIAALHGWNIWAKDVTMAYLQSDAPLSRSVYIRPPKKPALVTEQCSNRLLKVIKPLYGLVDSGLYWFPTYTSAFRTIGLIPASLDECLLYRLSLLQQQHPATAPSALDGVAGMLVGDTLIAGRLGTLLHG
jgi:hypothetical protein